MKWESGFPILSNFCDTIWVFYNLTQFCTVYLEVASDPTGEGLSPNRLPLFPHQKPNASGGHWVSTASVGYGYTPDLLPLGLDYLLEQLTEVRETLLFTSLLKGTDEQPDEVLHRVNSGRVVDSGASVPVELGCITSWYRDVFTTREVL